MQERIKKITQLTNLLKTKYPEYYRYLDENPMTLPVSEDPNVSQAALKAYLESLRSLLKHTQERQRRLNRKSESKTLQR